MRGRISSGESGVERGVGLVAPVGLVADPGKAQHRGGRYEPQEHVIDACRAPQHPASFFRCAGTFANDPACHYPANVPSEDVVSSPRPAPRVQRLRDGRRMEWASRMLRARWFAPLVLALPYLVGIAALQGLTADVKTFH